MKAILNGIAWMIIGIPMTVFLVLRDIKYLIKILADHQGCRASLPD
jgi:hypothetical protein